MAPASNKPPFRGVCDRPDSPVRIEKGAFLIVVDHRVLVGLRENAWKAALNPRKAIEYLGVRARKRLTELAVEGHRYRESIDRQRPYIRRFIEHDEFVLIVLDACRFDAFDQLIDDRLDGRLTQVWAAGRWTADYAKRTWTGFDDLTYLSSIPVFSDFYFELRGDDYRPSDHLKSVVPLWDDQWDPVLGTVPPEAVTDAALGYRSHHDHPRLVVHYAQPHVPYIGETRLTPDDEFYSDSAVKEGGIRHLLAEDLDRPTQRIYRQIQAGRISDAELRQAYVDNLAHVLEEVTRLVRHLDCPVVITSDHGEHLGEDGRYLHEADSSSVRRVPWFVVDESETREKPIPDRFAAGDYRPPDPDPSNEELRDRLADLGYFE